MSRLVEGPEIASGSTVSRLGDVTWAAVGDRPVLLVPLGSCEQHGPHLPLDTDTRIAVAIAESAAAGRDGVFVAPALAFGASWEHDGFPGLLSLNTEVLTAVLVELAHSADWAAGIVLVNGHGGNHRAVEEAVGVLRFEGRNVRSWWPSDASLPSTDRSNDPGTASDAGSGTGTGLRAADFHAGRSETSMMLAIDPSAVRLDRAERGWTGSLESLRSQPVRALSPNGVLGDPAGASAEEGRILLDRLATDLRRLVGEVIASGVTSS